MPRAKDESEFATIDALARVFGKHGATGLTLGIGDDAAVIAARGPLAWTIDSSVEGVHFERGWLTLEQIGYRSFQAAASDVCAMGGRPRFALSSVIVPRALGKKRILELGRGQERAARELRCAVVGGNLARGDRLSVTTSVLGSSGGLTRKGARPGDELWLLGELGLSALGLALLRRGKRGGAAHERAALAAFREPRARLSDGLALATAASSAIDVSDGLCGDAAQLARASRVRVVIDAPRLRKLLHPALLALAPKLSLDALELALYGGEDYALLATGRAENRPRRARTIGRVSAGRGVWLADGEALTRARRGFEHF